MPRRFQRTRSKKRSSVRLPGGEKTIHYKHLKVSAPHCSRCGRPLQGIPRVTPSKLSKFSASQKRSERVYGGQLCHICLRELLKRAVRSAPT